MKAKFFVVEVVLSVLFCLMCNFHVYGEEERKIHSICPDCNAKDSLGRKTGLWIEDEGFSEIYYTGGLRNGLYKDYNRVNGKLLRIGMYRKGKPTGEWYYFDEQSHLVTIEKDISKNRGLTVKLDDGKLKRPVNKSYVISYYSNGVVREEGIALYDEDSQIDFCKYGKWKYYDERGKLIKIKIETGWH